MRDDRVRARRRRGYGAVVARRRDRDLVAFDVSSDAAPPSSAAAPPPRPGPVARWRAADPTARRRAARRVAVGALVVVVAAGVGVATVAEQRGERLRAAPGGVVSLDGPLAPVWGATVHDVAAVLPAGGLATVEGEQVVARDVATGALRWQVVLGADVTCGPRPRPGSSAEWATPAGLVTCVHGTGAGRAVTVLDTDGGVVGTRALPAPDDGGAAPVVVPGADGSLVVAHHDTRLDDVLEFATSQDAFEQIPRVVPDDVSARVVVVDALTGRTRAEVPVRVDARFDGLRCYRQRPVTPEPTGRGSAFVSDLTLPAPVASPSVVLYEGCGVAGAATYDGVDLGVAAPDRLTVWVAGDPQQPDRDGFVTGDGTRVVSAGGDVALDVPEGDLLAAAATDGRSSLRFARVGSGSLVALDGETERWRAAAADPWVLAATRDVVVVGGQGVVVAFAADGGAPLWQVAPEGREWWPVGAVTDGRTVVTGRVELRDGVPFPSLLRVDLSTGEWTTQELRGDQPVLPVAVDGHLLLLDVTAVDATRRYDVTSVRVLAPR
ncbi:hypothetical protein I598_2699 [Isoptericola dokdonensis DS-3]|uniref:PQQ enzyme repeat protein n=1 Tax=Isoptericola dokdonensis DS-3 TaxID=1300344 RepID=A0A161I8V6_9MICO|nr:hypothetical protein I598_2699 [Isoptericola dokdonensis DS-3]